LASLACFACSGKIMELVLHMSTHTWLGDWKTSVH